VLAWKSFPELLKLEIKRNGEKIEKIVRLEERPYIPLEKIFKKDTQSNIIKLIYGIELEYFNKNIFSKKYKALILLSEEYIYLPPL